LVSVVCADSRMPSVSQILAEKISERVVLAGCTVGMYDNTTCCVRKSSDLEHLLGAPRAGQMARHS
jgi:hypothetical protein